jgi:hypothetical protein
MVIEYYLYKGWQKILRVLLNLLLMVILGGCASYKIPTEAFQTIEPVASQGEKASCSHWLYDYVPRHRSQIRWYDVGHWTTWMLFGNDDAGIFCEEEIYKNSNEPATTSRAVKCFLRNPFHNFCFYVIGSAHRKNSELTLFNLTPRGLCLFHYSPEETRNFGSDCSALFCALHGGKPFVSLRVSYTPNWKGDFYIGWRKRGNFGVKFVPLTRRKSVDAHRTASIVIPPRDL